MRHYGKNSKKANVKRRREKNSMNNNSKEQRPSGVGFPGLLQVAFIVLKLTHVIDWSWWWVLSPIWITIAILLIGVWVICIISGEDEE